MDALTPPPTTQPDLVAREVERIAAAVVASKMQSQEIAAYWAPYLHAAGLRVLDSRGADSRGADLRAALLRMVNETYEAHHTPSSESGPEEWDYTLTEPTHAAVEQALRALAPSQPVPTPEPLDRLDRMIEKAWRWKDAGWYSEAEWPAVAATLFVNDHESLTPEERERAIVAGQRVAARLAIHDEGSTPDPSHPGMCET